MVSEGFQWFQMVSERFDFSTFLDFSGPAAKDMGADSCGTRIDSCGTRIDSCATRIDSCATRIGSHVFGGGSRKVQKSRKIKTFGNHLKPLETFGNHWKPFGNLRKASETLGNLRKPSKTFENVLKKRSVGTKWAKFWSPEL